MLRIIPFAFNVALCLVGVLQRYGPGRMDMFLLGWLSGCGPRNPKVVVS